MLIVEFLCFIAHVSGICVQDRRRGCLTNNLQWTNVYLLMQICVLNVTIKTSIQGNEIFSSIDFTCLNKGHIIENTLNLPGPKMD